MSERSEGNAPAPAPIGPAPQGVARPLPRYHGSVRLDTLSGVREEQARVYRLARSGRLDARDATALTFMLAQLVRTLRVEQEERVEQALEGLARRVEAAEAENRRLHALLAGRALS